MTPNPFRLARVTFDRSTVTSRSRELDHERAVAVSDLMHASHFKPEGHAGGPYQLTLGVSENRLMFEVATEAGERLGAVGLSFSTFRRVVRDYAILCESYYEAMNRTSLTSVEALDMGRRGLHNEGAELLQQRLAGKIEVDYDTARRLFTLIYVLMSGSTN